MRRPLFLRKPLRLVLGDDAEVGARCNVVTNPVEGLARVVERRDILRFSRGDSRNDEFTDWLARVLEHHVG